MIQLSKDKCCGCKACEKVCSHRAIQMEVDKLGFAYPKIDLDKCVDCGLCNKVCPFENVDLKQNEAQKAYAVRHKDLSEIAKSRSGAAFIALSNRILEQERVVYGAGFSGHFKVTHKRAENKIQRDEFRGSKYAQSDLNDVFPQIKNDLKDSKTVLFSGTPCQVAALQHFIPEKLKPNLFCIDIVCHGVASPQVWDDFIFYIEKKEKKTIVGANFRDKNIFGWSGLHRESFKMMNGKTRTYPFTYYQPFLLRECCHYCSYASIHRPSDITIGDFWGWQKVVSDMTSDDTGVSLVLCNTSKGHELFEASSEELNRVQVPLESCLQPNLLRPTQEDDNRKLFEKEYEKRGFDYVRKRYWKTSLKQWTKHYIKRLLGR